MKIDTNSIDDNRMMLTMPKSWAYQLTENAAICPIKRHTGEYKFPECCILVYDYNKNVIRSSTKRYTTGSHCLKA